MSEPTATIRVYWKDWQRLKKLFPSIEGESVAMYLRRYVEAMKNG